MVYKAHHKRPRTRKCVCCGLTLTKIHDHNPMCEECIENERDAG
jgi:hypothetical protein